MKFICSKDIKRTSSIEKCYSLGFNYPKISHDFAVCHRSNSDKHLEEFALRQILRQVVDDQIGPRRIITGTTRVGAG
jgi:hypothetical protein